MAKKIDEEMEFPIEKRRKTKAKSARLRQIKKAMRQLAQRLRNGQ